MNALCVSLLVTLAGPLAADQAAGPRRPNVVLLYSDDHGWADLGAQGVDADVRTPHLDRLARDGVLFRRGYVTAPQCVPSRAGVITGRYQQRFGVEDNNKGPLPLAEVTLAERLKPAGYTSGWIGKCHLDIGEKPAAGAQRGKAARILPDHMPHRQGFDEYFRGERLKYYASHAADGSPYADAPREVADNRFRVVVQTEAALAFLDRRAAKPAEPWFLYLAWYAPHVPLESPEPWFSQTPAHLPHERRQALAMIAAMDDGLGRLREKIKAMGQENNTLIFFIGDNGAPLGKSWDGSINQPLVGQKGMLTEGGIRTPFVAAWPGVWPAGVVFEQPVISLDVAATANALAGLPPDARLDGVDLSPYVTGQKTSPPHETLYWRWGSQAALLEMPYKLVKIGDRKPLLFDLTKPEGEQLVRNLADQRPEIAARLEEKLTRWAAGLQPPGFDVAESAFNRHHEQMFAEHGITEPPAAAAAADDLQGWVCRSGTIEVQAGRLVVAPAAGPGGNARLFLTRPSLDLEGPATVRLRLRASTAGDGQSVVTWRTKAAAFEPRQSAAFDWPVGDDWREVQVKLPEPDRIIHLRITPAKGARGLEVQSIELEDRRGQTRTFRFGR